MLIAFLSLMNGTSPGTCMMKALAAYLVFAGFGMILRFALSESQDKPDKQDDNGNYDHNHLNMIVSGTSIDDYKDLLDPPTTKIGARNAEDEAA